MLLILVFGVSASFASADADNMQSNDNGTLFENEISVDDVSSESSIISTSQDDDVENENIGAAGGDGADDVLSDSPGTFSQLNNLITNSGTNVDLDNNYTRSDTFGSNTYYFSIRINSNKIIDGHGNTLNGNNVNSRGIFYIEPQAKSITFKNIVFKNAKHYSVYCEGPMTSVEFINCTFIDNGYTAVGFGDTVNKLTVVNCTFKNNVLSIASSGGGGAIYAHEVYNANFTNVSFIENSIKSTLGTNSYSYQYNYRGGAIYFSGAVDNLIFDRVNFTGNKAIGQNAYQGYQGGAIYYASGSTNVQYLNCTFKDNQAKNGGAIYVNDQSNATTFNDVTFISNNATYSNQRDCGGAIYVSGSVDGDTYKNVTIRGSNAYHGAAFYIKNDMTNTQFDTVDISNNVALYYSTFACFGNFKNNVFYNVNFTSNTGGEYGALYVYQTFAGNVFNKTVFSYNTARYGAGIHVSRQGQSDNNTFIDVNFTKNTATEYGGAIYFGAKVKDTNFTITADSNSAGFGGAIYYQGQIENIIFDHSRFINNAATKYNSQGGALYFSVQGSATFNNTEFTDNKAKKAGGAIRADAYDGVSFTFYNVNFTRNSVSASVNDFYNSNYQYGGGAISTNRNNHNKFYHVNFVNNSAEKSIGGAIQYSQPIHNDVFDDVNFTGNIARWGGAISAQFAETKLEINNSNFKNNKADYGGAFWSNYYSESLFDNVTFANNTAVYRGGAVEMSSSTKIRLFKDTKFINNTAEKGGALSLTAVHNITFDGVEFVKNTADYGGAIYLDGKTYTTDNYVDNSIFANNSAKYGGVLYANEYSSIEFATSSFEYNSAESEGILYSEGFMRFHFCNFTKNDASTAGLIYFNNFNNSTYVENSRFVENKGDLLRIYRNPYYDSDAQFEEFENVWDSNYDGHLIIAENVNITYMGFSNYTNNRNSSIVLSNIENCQISNLIILNNSASTGGLINIVNSSVSGNYISAVNNTAVNGGVFNLANQSLMSISRSEFWDNYATRGGVFYIDNSAVGLNDQCFFVNNTAELIGGAIYSTGISEFAPVAIYCYNSGFYYNTAGLSGGAIYASTGSIFSIDYVEFINNTAGLSGGAIANIGGSGSQINLAYFINNTASRGSAIDNRATTYISNALFLTNKANATLTVYYNARTNQVEITYSVKDNYINAINDDGMVNLINVTYFDYPDNIKNSDADSPVKSYFAPYKTITVEYYRNGGQLVATVEVNTDENGIAAAEYQGDQFDYIRVYTAEDDYYFATEKYALQGLGDFDILQNLISSNTNGTLDLQRDYTYTMGMDTIIQGIIIDKPITINGNGYSIDALYQSRIFKLLSDDVTFNNVVFKNSADKDGSFIYGENVNNTEINGCVFYNSGIPLSSYDGLGFCPVDEFSLELLFNDSDKFIPMFDNNVPYNYNGGAIYITGDSVSIKNSEFTAIAADIGGAVFIYADNVNLDNVKFDHMVGYYGGAIYVNGKVVKITDSQFSTNIAGFSGGSILAFGSDYDIINSRFNDTYAFGERIAPQSPGIIVNPSTDPGSGRSARWDNNVLGDPDYGALIDPGIIVPASQQVDNNLNLSEFGGGAINIHASSVNILDSKFSNSVARAVGGAIFAEGIDCIINNCTFEYCYNDYEGIPVLVSEIDNFIDNLTSASSTPVSPDPGILIGPDDSEDMIINEYYGGGAIFANVINMYIDNSTFYMCNSSIGGAVCSYGENTNILNSNFTECLAYSGGAVILIDKASGSTIKNCIFTDNVAKVDGGAISCYANDVKILDSTFDSNMIIFDYDSSIDPNTGSTLLNLIVNGGGAIYIYGSSNALVSNSNFINNRFRAIISSNSQMAGFGEYMFNGGAIFLIYSVANITDCGFENNSALNGGAIASLTDMVIGPRGQQPGAVSGQGGEYGNPSASPDYVVNIDNCEFENNFALYAGAVLTTGGNNNILNSKFYNNTGFVAGAVYLKSSYDLIRNSTFDNNSAFVGGALISGHVTEDWVLVDSGKTSYYEFMTVVTGELNEITGSTFTNNVAESSAAALIIGEGSKISNSSFTDNGIGSIYDRLNSISRIDEEYYDDSLNECLRTLIQSSNMEPIRNRYAGAVYWIGGNGEIFNVTFTNNKASADSRQVFNNYVVYNLTIEDLNVSDKFGYSELNDYCVELLIQEYYGEALQKVRNDYEVVGIDIFFTNYSEVHNGDYLYNVTLMYVFNMTVHDSETDTSQGGAIYWLGNNGNVVESTFNNNSASFGGAISWAGNDGYICDSTFNSNHAIDGGAVLLQGNGGVVFNSTFIDNHAINQTACEIVFENYTNIYENISNPSMEINGVRYSHVEDFKRAYLYYNVISQYIDQYDYVTVLIHEFTVSHQVVTQQEISPLYDSGDEMGTINYIVLDIEVFCYNKVTVIDDSMSGGAVYVGGENSRIGFSTFENNTADNGGAVFIIGDYGGVYESAFSLNTANKGGAVYLSSYRGYVEHSNFTDNFAVDGGALYCNGSEIEVYESNFANNSALNGGAIYWNGDYGNVELSNFTGNKADIGGAVYVVGNMVGFKQSNFYNNAAKFGGAVYTKGYAGFMLSEFKNNKANFGSAVYVEYDDVYIDSTTFLENQANANSLEFSVEIVGRNIIVTSIFTGNDNLINALYVNTGFTFNNVTYWSSEGIVNSDVTNPQVTSLEAGINITITLINVKYSTEDVIINITDVMGETTTVIPNVRSGRYYVIASHEEDDYYTKIGTYEMIQVGTKDSSLDVDVDDIFYRQNATVDITVDKDAVGNVTIWLNDEYYTYLNLTSGRASLNISGLVVGTYNVTVRYNGSEDYDYSIDTVEFKVKQINSTVNVTTDRISNGARVPINITVGPYDDVTGKVFVTIEDTFGVTIVITNTTDLQTVATNLADGNYTIGVYYIGDNNYLPSSNSTNFTVENSVIETALPTMNVTVEDIDYLENATAYISISSAVDGSVIITVGENQFTGNIRGGRGIVNLTNLSGGLKTAYVNFTSADKKLNLVASTKFMVNRLPTQVDVKVDGKSLTVNITDGASGNLTVYVNNAKHEFYYVGTAIELNDVLIYGNNTIVANYAGNENYTGSQNITYVAIEKNEAQVNVTADSITYGRDAVIIVNVGDGQSGYVTINVAGKNYTSIIDSTQILFNIPGLEVEEYPVGVMYSGDSSYKSQNNKTSFNVTKADLSATVVGQNIYVNENASFIIGVPANFNGYVNITVDGKKYSGEVKSLIVMDRLTPGSKIADVIFYGDSNYNDLPLTAPFTVSRMPTTVNVTVADVDYPNNSTAVVTVSGNASGTVEIAVGDEVFGTFNVVKGYASVDLGILSAGIKNLTAKFTVSDLMNENATASTKFVINKANSTVGITNEGTSVVVNVVPAVEGNLTVYVNGEKQEYMFDGKAIKWENILLVGNNTVMVVYEGNENYSASQADKVIEIPKNRALVNVTADTITYGDEATVTVRVGEGQGGHVTITVNNREYTSEIRNGGAVFTIPGLNATVYPINVTYSGDANYESEVNGTTLIVNKADLGAVVTGQNVTVNDNSSFVINNVPSSFKGYVNITVDGKTYSGEVKSLVVMDKLAAGDKTANVVFYGDDNYNDLEMNVTFTVSRVSVDAITTIQVSVENVVYGNNATAIIRVSGNANGTVVVSVDGNEFDAKEVINGSAIVDLGVLSAGIKNVSAVFAVNVMADSINSNATGENKFVVSKAQSDIEIAVSGTDVTINVTEGSESTVAVYINGVKHEVAYDGSVILLKDVLSVGNNTVLAIYEENDNFTSSQDQKDNIIIAKKAASVNVTADAITYGSDAVIVVNVGENQTGTVTIDVDGKVYTSIINGTQIIFNIPGLNATDSINVGVVYSGDAAFENATNSTTLTVMKADLTAAVEGQNITVNDNPLFVISNVPDTFKGYVNITVDGKTYSGEVKSLITMDKLTAGDKTATAIFYGDDNYNALTLTDVKFTVSRVVPGIGAVIDDVEYPNKAVAVITVSNNANGTVSVTVDGKVFNGTVFNGMAIVELTELSAGNKVASIAFFTDDDYNANATANNKFTVNKANSTVLIDVEAVYVYGDTIVINLTSTGSNGAIDVTINGISYPVSSTKQVTVEMGAGDYAIIANLAADENYTEAVNSTTFKVKKAPSSISIDVESAYLVGEDIVITLSPVNSTGAVNVTVNGKHYEVESNKITISGGLEANDYTIHAILAGDDNHDGADSTESFKVVKNNITMISIESTVPIFVGSPVTFTAKLNESVSGDVIFTINGVNYVVNVSDSNVASFTYTPLNNKTLTVVATFTGNDKYNGNVSAQGNFDVSRLATSIDLAVKTPLTYGDDAFIVVTIDPSIDVAAKLIIDGKEYDIALVNGRYEFNASGLNAGNHEIKAVFAGDDKYVGSDVAKSFEIAKADLPARVTALNVTVLEDSSFVIEVPDDFKGKVNITVDGITYSGEAESLIAMGKLTLGDKVADVVFYGDENYNNLELKAPFKVTEVGVIEIVTIKADDMVRGYNSEFDYQAAFLKESGDALVNAKVQFIVNGKTYDAITDESGIAHLTGSKLAVGKYSVTVVNTVSGQSVVRQVEIVKRIAENKDLTMDFWDGSYFRVKVYGDDGNIAPEGEIISITANGVHYVAKVDKNGYATLKIKLLPKTYTVVTEYKGYKVTNKLVVKQTLKPVKKVIKVKKSKKSFKIKAKLKWSNGKPITGKKITFKFKGKTYKAKTNKKGIASVKINKKVIKKLKKGKTYKVIITYAIKDKYGNGYVTIKDTVKCKVKVKK